MQVSAPVAIDVKMIHICLGLQQSEQHPVSYLYSMGLRNSEAGLHNKIMSYLKDCTIVVVLGDLSLPICRSN